MKKTGIIIALFLLLIPGCTKTDVGPEQAGAFIKFFGNYLSDEASDVKQTGDGGYIVIGTTTRPEGHTDVVLVKTDQYGNEEWSALYGGPGNDEGNSVQLTSDGGYILCGTFQDTLSNETDLYLIKTNAQGGVTWERTSEISPAGNQVGNCVQELSDGFILVGRTDENGNEDALIVRTNQSGEIDANPSTWYEIRGYGNYDEGRFVITDPETGNFLVAGTTEVNDAGDILVFSVTPNGVGWSPVYIGGNGRDEGISLIHATGNEYIVKGTMDEGPSSSMLLHKIRYDGNQEKFFNVWNNPVSLSDGGKRAIGGSVFIYENGDFGVLGSSLTGPGNYDFYFVRTDGSGNALQGWSKTYGGTGNEFGNAIAQTSDGGFVMAGSTGIPEDENRMIALIKVTSTGSFN